MKNASCIPYQCFACLTEKEQWIENDSVLKSLQSKANNYVLSWRAGWNVRSYNVMSKRTLSIEHNQKKLAAFMRLTDTFQSCLKTFCENFCFWTFSEKFCEKFQCIFDWGRKFVLLKWRTLRLFIKNSISDEIKGVSLSERRFSIIPN